MTLNEQTERIAPGQMCNDLLPELIQACERAVHLAKDYNKVSGPRPQGGRNCCGDC